jgi:predicted nucleotidyltransferase
MKAKKSGQSVLLFLNIADILSKEKVPYAVVGAFAASFYGVIRGSMDVDVIISLTASALKVQDLVNIFHQSALRCDYRQGDYQDPLLGVIKIRDKYGNQVDLITGIKGMDEDVFGRTIAVSFLKHKICLIGIEDFIAMKIFAGSPKDIEDATGVLKVSRQNINVSLLRKLTQKYGSREARALESLL